MTSYSNINNYITGKKASSVLKTSEFSRVHSTSENSDVFNSLDEIYLVFTEKSKLSLYMRKGTSWSKYSKFVFSQKT